jgi:hypothetical protein
VLLDHHTNLLREISSGRKFGHPLADHLAFTQIPLAFSDEILFLGVVATVFGDGGFGARLFVRLPASFGLLQLLE